MTTPELPQPNTSRWQPLRSGLINLFHFADEQFWYEHGRLLLRGNNGTGKSRVLALQLPFLLDAELSPTRMEPDRSMSKRPEWNLLLGGKHRDRLGYTWIEFGRLDPEGGAEYFTLGGGLHAVEHRGGVDAWFFTTSERIDRDLQLVVDSVPLSKSRLAEVLGDDGAMYRTHGDYRRAVDEKLFRLGNRYRSLVDLLIQLRVPQLSRDFDEQRMSAQLSGALPPLSVDVLSQVADAMQDLDEERGRLEELRRSETSVRSFRDHYRQYLRIALKRRVRDILTLHNRYERALRTINEDRRQLQDAIDQNQRVIEKQEAAETNRATTRATLAALRSRPEMDDARRLDDLRSDCAKLRQQSDDAQRAVEDSKQRLQEARRQLDSESEQAKWHTKRTQSQLDRLLEHDLPEAVMTPLRRVSPKLVGQPDAAKKLDPAEKATEICFKALATLQQRQREMDRLRVELQRHIDRQNDLEAQLESCGQRLVTQTNQLTSTKNDLQTRLIDWFDQSELLSRNLPSRQDWLERLLAVTEAAEDEMADQDLLEENPLEAVIDPINSAIEATADQLGQQRQQLDTRAASSTANIDELESQRQRLLDGVHLPPSDPPFRDPDARTARRGGPLYEMCDFADEIPVEERANWEAALEASGLLDAWVTPDGDLDAPHLADTTLLAGEPIANPQARLACVLRPSTTLPNGMSPRVIQNLLASIGCGKESAAAWVDRDGSWQIGPARGFWTKPEVQHIGAAARERRRQQQIETIQREIEAARTELQEIQSEIKRVQDDRETLKTIRLSIPADNDFRLALAARRETQQQQRRTQESLHQQLRQVGEARSALDATTARRDRDAADVGLSDWIDRLAELVSSLQEFRHQIELLCRDLESLQHRLASVDRAQIVMDSAAELLEKQKRQDKQIRDDHAAKTAQLQTLQSSVGQDVQKILADIDHQQSREGELEAELKELQDQFVLGTEKKGRLEGKLEQSEQILTRHEEDRGQAILRVTTLCEMGLAAQALESQDPEDSAVAVELPDTPWSPTRAAQIAKQVRSALADTSDSDTAWDSAQNEVQVQFRSLEQSLLPTSVTPQSQNHDEISVVTVPFQGVVCSPSDLSRQLSEEVRHRETLITERERELFEQRLIGDIAQSLHTNIREAHELCSRMNDEVESRPMSTGMRLRFRWHPSADSTDELKIACKALLRKPSAMSEDDRTALGQFLQQRIAEARSQDDVGTWQQHLADALDYRAWFTFDIERETDGRWQRLTRRTHGTGSGGERAVALIMPMLAALAAYYQSADDTAPRILLMDEAFVGIDNEMRAKFMDLMVQFDLDFVMTSEREWGCYPTMPALAIYHLSTRRGIDAILPTRWVWNGSGRVQSDVHDPPRQKEMFAEEEYG